MFVVVVVKTSYGKETKKEENNRRQNERSPSRDKKAMMADFALDQKLLWNFFAKCYFTKKNVLTELFLLWFLKQIMV